MSLIRSAGPERSFTRCFCLQHLDFKWNLNFSTKLKSVLSLAVISALLLFCEICFAKNAPLPTVDEPFTLDSKNVYTYYALIGINCLGTFGWIFRTWWGYNQKKNDKTQDILQDIVLSMDSLKKDVHYLTLNSISKADAIKLVRQEMEYVEEVRRR